MTSRLMSGCAILSLAVAAGVTSPALAQEETESANDIIVTAQKRSQSINDVGLSITALDSDSLKDRGITETADLVKAVSGLTFTNTLSGPPVYTLRGVGFYEASLAAAPAVTVYVDEAPLAFPIMSQVAVLDIERVEVLKGPQGTLYGENSTGGAINYIAARPRSTFGAGGSVTYARFGQLDASGYVTTPLSDTLKARVAFRAVEGGAWQRSYTHGDELGETRQLAGRLLLDWEPTSRLTVKLGFNAWRDRSDFLGYQLQEVGCANPLKCPFVDYPVAPQNARAADWTQNWPMRVRDDFQQATLRADYDLGSDITFTSLTSYQHLKSRKFSDSDAMNIENMDTRNRGEIDSFNQELRLSGQTRGASWVAGLYYSNATIDDEIFYAMNANSATGPIPGVPPFQSVATGTRTKLDNYAAFGNIELPIADRLSAVAGIRYTQSNRHFAGCTRDTDGTFAVLDNAIQQFVFGSVPNPVPVGGCIVLDENFVPTFVRIQFNQDNVSWRGGLNWKSDGGTLVYGLVSKGYKAGSIPVVSAATTAQYKPVTQESLLAYEVGVKAPLLGRALQVNASAFYYDYQDKQLRGRFVDPFFGLLEALVSIPKSQAWGVEAEITARPVDGLQMSGSVTYMETEVRRYQGLNSTGVNTNFAGAEFPYSPRLQMVGDIQYSWDLPGGQHAFVGAGGTYHSTSYSTIGKDLDYRIRPYALLDLRAGLRSSDDRWSLTVWGKNVTNNYYWSGVFKYIDTRFRFPGKPATYGVTLGVTY